MAMLATIFFALLKVWLWVALLTGGSNELGVEALFEVTWGTGYPQVHQHNESADA